MKKNYHYIWLFILFCLASIFGKLLYTQKIALYLSPRMTIVAGFGLLVLLTLFIYHLWKIFANREKGENSFRLSYLLFIVPILLQFTSAPDDSTINQLPNQNVNISYGAKAVEDEEIVSDEQVSASSDTDNKKTENTDAYKDDISAIDETYEEEKLVDYTENPEDLLSCVLTDSNWEDQPSDQFLECIYYEFEDMIGTKVTVHGFIMKDENFPDGIIVVARQIISCCAADAIPAGFPVKVENADDFAENEWVVITGTIDGIRMESYGDYADYPVITDGIIIRRDTPPLDEQYVYP